MYHEQAAKTRQGMEKHIKDLESELNEMHSDFAQCAKGKSPCFFCANDETCTDGDNCNFVWAKHN